MLPTAKLSSVDKEDTAQWLPYYAGYSQLFVVEAFKALNLNAKDVVLDPWSGSGTTGLVAQQTGIQCLCVEINPIVAFIAGARLAMHGHNAAYAKKLTHIVESVAVDLAAGKIASGVDLLNEVQRKVSPQSRFALSNQIVEYANPNYCLLVGAAAKAARSTLAPSTSKNPTWRHIDGAEVINGPETAKRLVAEWQAILASEVRIKPKITSRQVLGDSRNLPIPANAISAVICSPPYLTRIDYAMHTKLEHDWMFGSNSLRSIRESTMGAPVVRSAGDGTEIGGLAGDILAAVREHESYAARRYYAKTYAQYFSDCIRSLREIHRVLKKNAVALIVVQNSHFKEIDIPLSEIYLDIWVRHFGAGEVISRHDVVQSMVTLNRAAKRSLPNRRLYEDVVALYK